MNEQIDWARLARYFAQEVTDEERAAVEHWRTSDPANARLFAQTERIWQAAARRGSGNFAAAQQRLDAHLRNSGRSLYLRRWLVAAVIAGALIGGSVLTRMLMRGAIDEVTYATAPGQRSTVRLADGSTVQLNVASTIHVTVGKRGARTVRLNGQAYFDVAHDRLRPFRVMVGSGVIEVRGTRFDVQAYSDDYRTTVAVEEGLVAVTGRTGEPLLVSAGQLADIVAGEAATLRAGGTDADFPVWRERRIRFDDVTLSQAITTLERWYGIDIVLADEALATRRITAFFDAESSEAVLEAIALSLSLGYRVDGNIVTLYPQ